MPHCSVMSMGTPFFISKLKFPCDKYSVDKVWTEIYCHFYFMGITLKTKVLTGVYNENDYHNKQSGFLKSQKTSLTGVASLVCF